MLSFRASLIAITPTGQAELRASYQDLVEACNNSDMGAITQADLNLHKTIVWLSYHTRLERQYHLLENQLLTFIATDNKKQSLPTPITNS